MTTTAPPPQDTTDKLSPQRWAGDAAPWQHLRKYWVTSAITVVAVMIATVFYTLGQKKIYEAEATVLFDPNPPRPLGRRVEAVVDLGAGDYWNNQEYYETQYHIIRSRRVALAVVRELGLEKDGAFIQDLPEGQEASGDAGVTPELAADVLRGRVKVEPVRDSRLAVVKLRDANPKRAQRILAALVDTYSTQNLENALDSTSAATTWLQKQLDTLKSDLETSELQLHQYKKKNDILSVAFDDKSSMLNEQMRQINGELTRAQAQMQQVSSRRNVLKGVPDNDPTLVQSTELLQSVLLNTLRAEYAEAIRDREALLGQKKGANHPEVAAADKRVKAAEAAILTEIHNVQRAVDRDVSAVSQQVGGLSGMLETSKKQAHELNLLEIEYNKLRRSKENTEKLYAMVLERTKEADLTQLMRVNNISIVDPPVAPAGPVHPRVPMNLSVGLLLGLVLGAGSAFARGLLDRTLKVPDEVENELGLPCLGLLPQFSEASQKPAYYARQRRRGKRVEIAGQPELVVHHEPMSSIAEASRAIRTNLMFMAPDKPYKTLLVTSAGPYEGKTTVACCIAVAMAQAGQSVLLIDCDLRRPRMHRIFGLGMESGVTTALLDETFEDVVRETAVPNMCVLPSGPIPPNPAELFHSDRFRRFLEDARSRFDRVIIDSPPLAAVTDPAVLSTEVDGTVLVVRAFKTRKEVARHALRSIQSVGGTIAGAVLNAVDFSRMEYRYAYYYYRRDDYYRSPSAGADDRESAGSAPPS